MPRPFPTGTVTFLFTDVEGSTRLLQQLGPSRYAAALAEHRLIVRQASDFHAGVEVDTQGDAFFFAFPSAPDALAAAAEAQDGLAAGPIRIRMGIHTGAPHLSEVGYVGEDVHLGARIAAAGHGGQVLLSRATAALVDGDLTDLGEHRLKDFDEPVWLFQLRQDRFPPLRTMSNTNLPRPSSSFVGRAREVADIVALVEGGARLLTLTGPGGTGKTRLAIEAAMTLVPDFRNGVFWVSLASLRDPGLVVDTIAHAVGARNGLAEHVADREMLVVVDNLEHVVEAAPDLAGLVLACPNLRILVTSRELLRVSGEVEYPILPLAHSDAVNLFCDRARMEPDAAVRELCSALDNLPLALELAAARARVLSPRQMVERISGRLDLLKGTRDSDPRQMTLRATIEWSHELLAADEQQLFARLAVFRGGCTLGAAEVVTGADLDVLQSLVDKSLVRHSTERFSMLETIREFAAERQRDGGETESLRGRHLEYFVAFVRDAGESEQGALIEDDLANIRAAVAWAEEIRNGDLIAMLATPLVRFWGTTGRIGEERQWLMTALEIGIHDPVLRGRSIGHVGNADYRQGRYQDALTGSEEYLRVARGFVEDGELFQALSWCANAAIAAGQHDRAETLYAEAIAIARRLDDPGKLAYALGNLGDLALIDGDYARGATLSRECAELAAKAGDVPIEVTGRLNGATADFHLGLLADARVGVLSALRRARNAHRAALPVGLELLAAIEAQQGNPRPAAVLMAAGDAYRAESGDSLEPTEQALRASTILALDGLGVDLVNARQEGGQMSLDEAVEFALDTGDP
jgi:predicted ATPase